MTREYKKVSEKQVLKIFKEEKKFDGFLVGNKVNPFHFHDGWHLAFDIETSNILDFVDTLQSMKNYLDKELGNNIAIYQYI